MFLTWCLESIPIPHPFRIPSPGFSKVMWLHQATRTMAIASVKVSRLTWWTFGCGGSSDDFWVRKFWNRKKRERGDCMIAMWWFTDFWRYLDQETNPRLPKLFKKLGFFRVCQHQRLGLVPGLWTVCIHLYPHIKSVHSTLAREFVL